MKLFVWDLHGTLEQGNEKAVIELSNMALAKLGYKNRFRLKDSRKLYGLKWYEYFERLLPDETQERHIELQALSFQLSEANQELIAHHMRPSPHAIEVLRGINNSPHRQILISNTVPSAVPLFVHALGMDSFFTPANAFSINAHAREIRRAKEDALAEYLADKHFEKLIIIGDSHTDLKLASAFYATSYLYSHPGYPFRAAGGDYRINDLREILKELD